jgi:quercetin 2,3-dioxygenase
MRYIYHPNKSRGHGNHGWLNSYHSFSFAEYQNSSKMNFGALRVLNDDSVSGGMGFSRHPHSNMEIVSIPLNGELKHEDSIGNSAIIKAGEVQIMSAGTGVSHSEKNNSSKDQVDFLQIWIFPKTQNIKPNYDQQYYDVEAIKNQFQSIVSPSDAQDAGVKINQDAWFSLADLDESKEIDYNLHLEENGTYIFVLEGEIEINGQRLEKRDAYGIWDIDKFKVKATEKSKILTIEVPMIF